MSIIKQTYALYRDDTLIASDLPYLVAVEKFARADARREHAHERPASYAIIGSSGLRRVGNHVKGRIRWDDQSSVHSCFGTPSLNGIAARPMAV